MENTITQKDDVRVKRKSQVIETAKRYMKNKLAVLGLLIFLVILFFALFAGKFGSGRCAAGNHGPGRLPRRRPQ